VPTIALYINGKRTIYEGERNSQDLYKWLVDTLREKLGKDVNILEINDNCFMCTFAILTGAIIAFVVFFKCFTKLIGSSKKVEKKDE
jgi:hypothetical protein